MTMAIVKLPIENLSYEWMGKAQDTLLDANSKHAIFTVGVSASGKTTWAQNFFVRYNHNWQIISRDNLRAQICVPFSWANWKKYGSKGEKRVNELQTGAINEAISCGDNIIICDTNLNPKNWLPIAKKLESFGYKIYFKFFDVDWKTAVERDNARANGVGLSVLAHQFEKLHTLERSKSDLLKHGGKDAVLCDIDGTLAHMTTRGPYDYDQVSTDSLDFEVFDILEGLYKIGYEIVIVSGRDGICREETHKWLKDHLECKGIKFYHYQRATGDKRPDDIVKEELLHQIIDAGFCPKMVFDDRPRVTRRWRALGLKVFQVGNPYIEF